MQEVYIYPVDMYSNVGRYGKFNIGIWYDSNITVYWYMHAATAWKKPCLFLRGPLPLGLLFAFFTSKCCWGRWTFRCESRFDVLPPFADTDFLHNRQITASWTFGLPSSSASNPKYIHTDDFAPLDFETRPSLSLVALSLLDEWMNEWNFNVTPYIATGHMWPMWLYYNYLT